MKNVFTKLTVGALMISLSITASAAGTAKDKSRDVRSKDEVAKAIETASAALKSAGVVEARVNKMKPLLKHLAENDKIDQQLLNAAANKLTLAAIADVTTGMGSGGKQEQLADLTLKVAAKIGSGDLELAVVEALAQGSNKTGDIFKGSDEKQIAQALVLAEKLMSTNSTRAAIADFLSSKKGSTVREDSKEVDDFIETLKGCVGKRA